MSARRAVVQNSTRVPCRVPGVVPASGDRRLSTRRLSFNRNRPFPFRGARDGRVDPGKWNPGGANHTPRSGWMAGCERVNKLR